MKYTEALKYINSHINYERMRDYSYQEAFGLKRIKDFLARIDNPQDSFKSIHVAGSKGKGSVCAFVSYILKEAGFKVGLYTSPHLSDFRERIRILNRPTSNVQRPTDFEGMIPKEKLTRLVEYLKPKIEKFNKKSPYGELTFFEAVTALAFQYFKDEKVDFAVLETGMGGRLDATNVVNPLVCAITSISYDHMDKLGNTLVEIAREKAGIIKRSTFNVQRSTPIIISALQEKEAALVIRNKCRKVKAKLYEAGRDIIYKKSEIRISKSETNSKFKIQNFKIRGILREYSNLRIKLLGQHQRVNAAVAVGVVEALCSFGVKIKDAVVRRGLYNTLWPARCEIVSKYPLVILDGAHNAVSSKVLKEAIRENFKYRKLILVLGMSQDKDIGGICQELVPFADKVILTQANNPRVASVGEIEKIVISCQLSAVSKIVKTVNVKEALRKAKESAGKKDLILVTGSLFVAGEARVCYKKIYKEGSFWLDLL